MMEFVYLGLIIFISFGAGWMICKLGLESKANGMLVLYDKEMYLDINESDLDKFRNDSFVSFKVKRRNFSGFNEET